MNFKDNPEYVQVFHSDSITLYAPAETKDYHISRYIAGNAQNIYSSCGVNREMLLAFMDEIITKCNDKKETTVRTDVGILANNIKYRLKYPVDEDCAIRMAAIYTFMDGEDPDKVNNVFTEAKIKAAHADPELYSFFLTEGIKLTPNWKEYEQDLIDTEYFQKRKLQLKTLLPV